jgi:hypothetical protein
VSRHYPAPPVKRTLGMLAVVLVLTPASGCSIGSDDGSPADDDSDKRALALECLREDKQVDARLDGEEAIAIGDADTGPRVVFFLTSGEAEAAQFEGEGEGAEQIGSALLFVRDGSDELLEDVEACLAEL